MPVFEKLKNILFSQDTKSYELTLEEAKNSLNKLIDEYNNFVELQADFRKSPSLILSRSFEKKDKYPEILEKIKYKDVEIIKEYELYAMKYNILVELYNKVKKYIEGVGKNIVLDFKVDKYRQTVAILTQYNGDVNKIVLIKNTFETEDYLYCKVDNNIEVTDICSKEPRVNHGVFMVEALIKAAEKLKKNNLIKNEITVSKELICNIGFENCLAFFKKQGFEVINGIITRQIE